MHWPQAGRLRQQLKLITQDNNFPIDISKFTIGVYFLKVTTKNNQIINQKIIKQ
jgi:hypothetical protein